MLSLAATQDVAMELYTLGHTASLKYALWGASLSPQKKLEINIKQAQTLLPYLHSPLPQDVEKVFEIVRTAHQFCSRNNAKYILKIEQLEREGLLTDLSVMPTSYHDWLAWREAIVALCPGVSYKATSFVALLMWPDKCPLVPVDSHVCARLGLKHLLQSASSYKVYRWIEKQVLHEWHTSGHRHDYSPAVWHWFKWSEWRQATGDEPVNDRPETHNGLSPYIIAA